MLLRLRFGPDLNGNQDLGICTRVVLNYDAESNFTLIRVYKIAVCFGKRKIEQQGKYCPKLYELLTLQQIELHHHLRPSSTASPPQAILNQN
jgi:hypothetical protein